MFKRAAQALWLAGTAACLVAFGGPASLAAAEGPAPTVSAAMAAQTAPRQTPWGGEFLSPSGNISCQFGEYHTAERNVYCQTIEPTESVQMSTSGAFKVCRGALCVGNPADNAPTLAYGTSTAAGPFRCLSTTSGVICTVRSGRGFEISRSGIVAVRRALTGRGPRSPAPES